MNFYVFRIICSCDATLVKVTSSGQDSAKGIMKTFDNSVCAIVTDL